MRNKVKIGILIVCIFLVGIGIISGRMIRQDSLLQAIFQQGKSEGYMYMLKTASPSLFFQKEEKSFAGYFMENVLHTIPVYGYISDAESYTTQVESDISYEEIIAREAADEEYVEPKVEVVKEKSELKKAELDTQKDKPEQNKEKLEKQLTDFIPQQTPVNSISREKLNDFDYLIQNFYVVDRTTNITSSQLNATELLSKSMKLTHGPDAPQILIYHTHSQEGFVDSVPGDENTSIVAVGAYLHKLLGEYGFHVLHHTGEYDVDSRDDAYTKAGPAVEQILRENPSIEVVIDVHRDGVAEGTHLVTDVNGKQTASIMFFNGLSHTTANGDISYLPNPYIKDNLAFSLQMQLAAEEYYPNFSRAIYLKGYRYNMHYCPKTLLVEVGAQTNTLQEALNAMEPLADILSKVLSS